VGDYLIYNNTTNNGKNNGTIYIVGAQQLIERE
jgi:hypothetical protein